ncbi:unnamed protein product [Ceratitis capitata]|uniref:(Mediterranean fruit fly) hypothetical protein n=1 Tax=Ceratitis capitata TaxID=7213 RepID=A0A811VCQ5_CERCA|nr:unnamed protein product [Ceratitis capitata]
MSSKIRHSTCLYVKEAGDNSPNTQTRSHSETTMVEASPTVVWNPPLSPPAPSLTMTSANANE